MACHQLPLLRVLLQAVFFASLYNVDNISLNCLLLAVAYTYANQQTVCRNSVIKVIIYIQKEVQGFIKRYLS